jgi:hypothetical protein
VIRTEEAHLAHYGILRRSGRYPWGSGSTQNKRNKDFLDYIAGLRANNMTDTQIAKGLGISRNELTAARSIARAQQKQQDILTAQRLKEKGWSNVEIGKRMGRNESSVRALLNPGEKDKADALQTTANFLKDQVNEKGMIDVGRGVEAWMGVTRTRLDTAIAALREEGYAVHNIQIRQIFGQDQFTHMKVLAPPGTSLSHVQQNRKDIKQIAGYSDDHGRSFFQVQPPLSINSKRLRVNYAEDGGGKADGVIYVRPGKKDLELGSDHYGQVRIAIDGTHYIKGMAVYKDDLPPGVDLVFNTSKSHSDSPRKKDVMKEMESDPDFPFGSVVRQLPPDPKTGKLTSAMNIVGVREGSGVEGSWDRWSRTLSSQMLSKQDPSLAKQQLDLTFERRQNEFNEINSLTNPTVRKELLLKFADQTDSASVHLKAANLPRQATKVILPVSSMKPTEVYAPSMRNGEQVALVRFPHGGTFEIPQLTVNNNNREARKLLGTSAKDAIGINHQVAHHLSGADFDGDTVLVIPNNRRAVKTTDPLEGLKGFDPQTYKIRDPLLPRMNSVQKGQEMGKISNLITDMTIHGANTDELARAIKHSMVVIDAEKHGLDYRQSEKDHGILALKERYQGGKRAGAQTLISRKGSTERIPQRELRPAKQGGPIDPVTGKKVYVPTGRMRPQFKKGKETGVMEPVTQTVQKLAVRDDAFSLVGPRNTAMENLYASHSNKLKAMANQARKEAVAIKPDPANESAKTAYRNEVASLNAKLNLAKKNAPLERQSQLLANATVSQKRQSNPHMEPEDVKKIKQMALSEARKRTGAKKDKIIISQAEWNAIQAGAVSPSKLQEIFTHSDVDTVRTLALPKHAPKMTTAKFARAQRMLDNGYTQQDVADALGVSLSTLKVALNE